ncbi:NAD-dependent epimerase/dehydratase family protein [Paraflavisolibacter sp. H34]|uniref:NAD-dependent epimerase/dehydratase family protein n=1 Tax=Huijunlia imazamoxiresistens TaxID=3127457 RepID=UPI003017AC11
MILITGGTGFIGAYIIKNLVGKGHAVRALRRSAKTPFFLPKPVLDKVEWVEGEVLDVVSLCDAMQGVTGVIHAAAVVSFSQSNRQQMYQTNIEGTANVVNAALEAGVERLVHVSSVAALGRSGGSELLSEQKKWEENGHNTHYAITKHKAELEVWRGFAEGLPGAIINPSTVLGYGDWHQSSCAIFKNVYREFPWYTQGINGFVGVEDVAEAAVQLLLSNITEKRFVVNADNIPFRQLFNTIADGFGKRPPHREATPLLGELAWRVEAVKTFFTRQKPLLTRETAKVAHSLNRFDNSALLKALPGFSYTPLDNVIRCACSQYLEGIKSGQLVP